MVIDQVSSAQPLAGGLVTRRSSFWTRRDSEMRKTFPLDRAQQATLLLLDDETGRPVADATVRVSCMGRHVFSERTDEFGQLQIEGWFRIASVWALIEAKARDGYRGTG